LLLSFDADSALTLLLSKDINMRVFRFPNCFPFCLRLQWPPLWVDGRQSMVKDDDVHDDDAGGVGPPKVGGS
jgi:hypothetical protein